MKRIAVTALIVSAFGANAQQKNIFLDQSFWKTKPNVETVKSEIANGNNPSESNPMAFDAVVMAINNDVPNETVKFLLAQEGNPINKHTHDSRIYLHWAAYRGNIELINYLIAKGSDINHLDTHEADPVAFAAGAGQSNPELYEAFIKAGYDIKKTNADGANVLLLAIASDKELKLTEYLQTKGLSIQSKDNKGLTAFDYAARSGNVELLKNILKKGVKPTENALITAAQGQRRVNPNTIEVFKYLVEEQKISAKATDSEKNTALHFIVNKPNQTEIINYLLSKGADANAENKAGINVFMQAANGKDKELLVFLLAKTKNINKADVKGETALTNAVKNSSVEILNFLFENGADITVLDKNGNNLAFYLVDTYRAPRTPQQKDDFSEKLNLLKSKGVNLSAAQKDGNTLYHTVATKNELDLLKKLEGLNIDINAKNKEGYTALHKAAMVAKDEVVLQYLVALGAKKDIKTEFDETAYELAKDNELLAKNNISVEFLR